MNLFHSDKTYEDLLQDMQKDGYSQNYMKCIRREIRWLEGHQNISSFEAACQLRLAQTSSPETQANRKAIYNLFHRYSKYGSLSEGRRNPLFRFGAYTQLSGEFKDLLDIYEKESYKRGFKTGTVRASISACSGLLLALQSSGFQSLEDVTESAVLDYFSRKKLSSSTRLISHLYLKHRRAATPILQGASSHTFPVCIVGEKISSILRKKKPRLSATCFPAVRVVFACATVLLALSSILQG